MNKLGAVNRYELPLDCLCSVMLYSDGSVNVLNQSLVRWYSLVYFLQYSIHHCIESGRAFDSGACFNKGIFR